MKNNIKSDNNSAMTYESLIERLKSQDKNIIKKNRTAILMALFLGVAWIVMFIVEYDYKFVDNDKIFHVFMFVIMSLTLIYRLYIQNKNKKVNYADPVKDLLCSAEKRYRFWNQKHIFEFIILIILGTVFGYYLYTLHVENWPVFKNIIVSVFVPIFLGAFSMIRLYLDWKKENRIIWISIKNLLKEFE